MLSTRIMRDASVIIQLDLDQLFHRVFFSFANRFRNFRRFSKSCADMTIAIAYNDERCETEVTTAFDNLGNTFDGYYFFI